MLETDFPPLSALHSYFPSYTLPKLVVGGILTQQIKVVLALFVEMKLSLINMKT